ncbi:RIP metalloprotease RseP [Acidicapsa ligni]|uniref:RIP metalloprotease RseP n=1 Tax=Acidicapsa ligni TaxID=542300 RepID=UPI0021DFB483|nr:RIP metalloprotease RseP [Acidicapsa ligni]
MHTVLVDLISVLIVLGIMVLVHEFGHFVAAKLCGVRVEQFSIGFPPRLFGIKIGETDYCISATPLGGYVKMTGETLPGENMTLNSSDAPVAPERDPGALTSHPRWQRIIIGVAGPFANFVLALGLMTGFYMLHNEVPLFADQPVTADWIVAGSPAANAGLQPGDVIVSFDSQQNPSWELINERLALNLPSVRPGHGVELPMVVTRNGQNLPLTLQLTEQTPGKDVPLNEIGLLPKIQADPLKISSVSDRTPAAEAGLKAGDQFQSIDGHVFHSTESIIAYLQQQKGAPVKLVVNHEGTSSTVVLQPKLGQGRNGPAWQLGFLGSLPPYRVDQLPFPKAVDASVKFNRENSLLILEVLKRVLTHKMSVDNLSGPIGIAQQTGLAAETPGWEFKIKLMTTISLNLGILNLLPFPILDGGMILFLLIESVIRRDINPTVKERVYQVAFVLIIVFFAYVIFNDISKLPIFSHFKS